MKVEIIANPTSGHYDREKLEQCAAIYSSRFGTAVITHTEKPNDAARIAQASNADLIVAAGGDGLVNEAVGGMAGKKALFSVLPFGTVNVFCREYKIPLNPLKAAHKLNPDNIKTIPLGYLNERPFVLMCGFGYDARVVKNVVEKGYCKNKTLAHIREGVGCLKSGYPRLIVHAGGRALPAYHIIISLGHCYAGSFDLSNHIKTGTLNIFLQQQDSGRTLLYNTFSIMIGGGFPRKPIFADATKITGADYAQLDGEYIDTGTFQNYIRVKKSALSIAL